MSNARYKFETNWTVQADISEVSAILEDVESLPQWWPSVYLRVKVLEPGGEGGVGRKVDLFTKGWLPYTLRWSFVVTESNQPHGFALRAEGDFIGNGVWTLEQQGSMAHIRYDWEVIADKPLIRNLSFLFKPIFAANHRWAMAKGEESLKLELLRRRGEQNVAAPPKPTFTKSLA